MEILKLAIVGAGGYARTVSDLVLDKGAGLEPRVQLVAVAEPDQQTHAERLAALRGRGVATFAALAELLARPDVEAVWLPVPIALHRPFSERALAAGKAVLCEKPVAGCIQDVDALIAARDRAGRPLVIGYQAMYQPATKQLKDRLDAGAIGAIRGATVWACWPRAEQYYRRNDWAGKFRHGATWVMDSPANNALAHYLQLALFLVGAEPVRVAAELYRVMPIENYDTISLRVTLAGDRQLLVLFTHACQRNLGPELVIHGTAGSASWTPSTPRHPLEHQLERFARLVKGVPDDTRLVATLETCRPQTVVVNAASEAAPVVPVPPPSVERLERDGQVFQAIPGIEEIFRECAAQGQMLHESRRFPFTQPASTRAATGYTFFQGPKV